MLSTAKQTESLNQPHKKSANHPTAFNHFFSILLLTIGMFLSSMGSAQEVKYNIETDNPEEVHKLSLSIAPFYVDVWSPNISMGWGLEGRFLLTKRLSVSGNFYSSYFQMEELQVDGKSQKTISGDVVGQFAFSAKSKKMPLKVVLSSSSDGKYSYTKYIMVDGQQMRKWNLRFGADFFGSPYQTNNARTSEIKGENGTIAPTDMMGTITTSGLIFGISREKYANLTIKTGDKLKGNGKFSNFYFDFMYNPVLQADDIEWGGETYEITDGDNGIEFKNTGWRIGYDLYVKMNKPVDLTMRFETGSRPGFKGKSFYAMLSFGMGLHFL